MGEGNFAKGNFIPVSSSQVMPSSTMRKLDIWSNTCQKASLKAAAMSEGQKRSKKYLPREIRRSHYI
jgi:hypothetical protein